MLDIPILSIIPISKKREEIIVHLFKKEKDIKLKPSYVCDK